MSNPVSINRQAVLELIRTQTSPQTSKQMARILGVKEVSVRAAITWLRLGGFIRRDGYVIQCYQPRGNKKKIALYVWTGRADPICQVRVKEVDQVEWEQLKKNYGDGGLALQWLILGLGG